MKANKQDVIELRQQETYTDMLKCLSRSHMCNVVRPTGFGKTFLFAKYLAAHPEGKTLYVYDVISAKENFIASYNPQNVDFISYYRLSIENTAKETALDIINGGYRTVIFDESHLMGGNNIAHLLKNIIPELLKNGTNIIGGTATPRRSDDVDVTETFFNGISTYEYSLADAIYDGIIENPVYSQMVYDMNQLEKAKKKCKNSARALQQLKQLEYVYAKRHGEAEIYRSTVVDTFGEVPQSMKFIVFYPTIQSMKDNVRQLRNEFEAAFPERKIIVIPFSSDPEHTDNYDDVFNKEVLAGEIHLITAVDILNQSYHSDDLTGIIMNRSTMSNVLFAQQLGRCLSVKNNRRSIIFDNVANCIKYSEGIKPEDIQKNVGRIFGDFHYPDGYNKDFDLLDVYVHSENRDISEWQHRLKAADGSLPVAVANISNHDKLLAKATQQIVESANISDEAIQKAIDFYNSLFPTLKFVENKSKIPAWLLLSVMENRPVLDVMQEIEGQERTTEDVELIERN